MSSLPNSLKNISLFLERLPGIGEKTANRLAFFLLNLPEEDLKEFAENVSDLKLKTKLCKNCFNFTEKEICEICDNSERDQSIICVVETVLDLLSFEQGRIYNGVYHVLHGKIDPLNRVGPDDIKINELINRIKLSHSAKASLGTKITEVILATNPDMEGEATAVYISNKLRIKNSELRISRLAYGLPMGANLEYADYMTLKKAIEGRNKF
ncbi:recombination protein RecR [Candidatus Roizmanbacteria bacterium CG_4_10_14_0_2_um_filter_33_96]|uniref:Recombination protein RecR n=3 Tax=Candidatus Roizmaniibacteriota TaxID=1752723 RepID=A0A2M7UAU5_9BACT|nr:MAG: recombination protein RecR [Candidatus Roizmanbacteria bacterium CG22_combo_CG10-13_8_21_14_all_34_12]PIZ68354.1 MAG: recombination protein RecR [Candidatus Roizmanbacteria bacterium CG_4_10_14_0_2_um_filter_33_96]